MEFNSSRRVVVAAVTGRRLVCCEIKRSKTPGNKRPGPSELSRIFYRAFLASICGRLISLTPSFHRLQVGFSRSGFLESQNVALTFTFIVFWRTPSAKLTLCTRIFHCCSSNKTAYGLSKRQTTVRLTISSISNCIIIIYTYLFPFLDLFWRLKFSTRLKITLPIYIS